MNILIILAHPEPKSMNGLLKDKAVQTLEALGYQTQVSDLYAQNFQDATSPENFPFYQEDFFDLQMAQKQSQEVDKVPPHIKVEQDKLRWAEVIIFQYPLWWYAMPAIMKAYVDSVFAVGFAYAGASELAGKKYILSFTTGAPEQFWTEEAKGTIEQMTFHLDKGTFPLLGMQKLPNFVGYGSKRLSPAERETLIEKYGEHLEKVLGKYF